MYVPGGAETCIEIRGRGSEPRRLTCPGASAAPPPEPQRPTSGNGGGHEGHAPTCLPDGTVRPTPRGECLRFGDAKARYGIHGKGPSAGGGTGIARARSGTRVLPACPRARNFTLETHSFGTRSSLLQLLRKRWLETRSRSAGGWWGNGIQRGQGRGRRDLCPAGCRGSGGGVGV